MEHKQFTEMMNMLNKIRTGIIDVETAVEKVDKAVTLVGNAERLVTPSFKWKDRQDNFYYPKHMETRHIFFTLLMIWNHVAPKEMQIEPFKRYTFGSFYTNEYMADAVKSLSAELKTRDDLTPYFIKCLKIIEGHIRGDILSLNV